MSTANVQAEFVAHLAILDVLNRYTDALNRRDWPALQQVFTAEGVWDMGGPAAGPMAMRFAGAADIAAGIAAAVDSAELCVQTNHAPVIEVSGRRATARSTMHELVRPKGGTGMQIIGFYHDDLSLGEDGEWRFRERRFRIVYVDTGTPVSGQVMPPPAG